MTGRDERKRVMVVELQHWPSVEYFAALLAHDEVWLEAHETFKKQSCRSRCYILTANGPERMTVPLLGSRNVPYAEIMTDESQGWRRKHWRALETAYSKSPYFEHYAPELEPFYRAPEGGEGERLFGLNARVLTKCLALLGVDLPIRHTTEWRKEYIDLKKEVFYINDLRNFLFCQKSRLLGDGVRYIQTFGNEFVPNMSVLDLLCCEGPGAGRVLRQLSEKMRRTALIGASESF